MLQEEKVSRTLLTTLLKRSLSKLSSTDRSTLSGLLQTTYATSMEGQGLLAVASSQLSDAMRHRLTHRGLTMMDLASMNVSHALNMSQDLSDMIGELLSILEATGQSSVN